MTSAAITYQVDICSIHNHIFKVILEIDNPHPQGQRLTLPAWIPGSYMIRDFAKNIVELRALDQSGQPVGVKKLDKQTWQLAQAKGSVKVEYKVYAFDLSIRSAYINDQFAFFNGTSLFLSVVGQEQQACNLILGKPAQSLANKWQVATTLAKSSDIQLHQFGRYQADNYAELIDHPVLIGEYDIVPFQTGAIDFELVLAGGHHSDTQRMADDLAKICQHHIDLFGSKPDINRYLFITLLTGDGYGGLEHGASTALLFKRDDLPTINERGKMPEGYRNFLALCSHEFFHTWHVKRIRPSVLAEANLAAEAYTEQLWIYEGFTSYYDDYALRRAGVITEQEYLQVVGQNLTRIARNKGRLKQTVTESSFDAWSKFYKQGPDAINNIVSYYTKGGIIAMCLDLAIREKTKNKKSLDNVMQYLWQKHGKTNVGTGDKVIHQILSEHLRLDLHELLNLALYSTKELPVETLLEAVGVKLHSRAQSGPTDAGGKSAEQTNNIAFGANYKSASTGITITQVLEDSSAEQAGLQIGDNLIAINGWQISQSDMQSKLENYAEKDAVEIAVLRDKRLLHLNMPIERAPLNTIYLDIVNSEISAHWLHS